MNQSTKICQFCAEEIKAAAIVCKHCGKAVGESSTTQDLPEHEFDLGRCCRCGASRILVEKYGFPCLTLEELIQESDALEQALEKTDETNLDVVTRTEIGFRRTISSEVAEPESRLVAEAPASSPDNLLLCPKCASNQNTAQKQGFGLGKAVAGGVLTGGVGLLAGFVGSGKVKVTCLRCGHAWKPGTRSSG